jgi:hypothetical protein
MIKFVRKKRSYADNEDYKTELFGMPEIVKLSINISGSLHIVFSRDMSYYIPLITFITPNIKLHFPIDMEY